MFHVLSLLVLWCSLLKSSYCSSSELKVETRGDFTFLEDSAGPVIIDYIGGVEEFKREVTAAMDIARTWRNNTPVRWSTYNSGAGGLVVKLCFADGICWADKMFVGSRQKQSAYFGECAMRLLHEYCPNIPLPHSKGMFTLRLLHQMTDWIEGKPLVERVFKIGSDYYRPNSTTFRIPKKMVKSLAVFVYNMSTCPIPNDVLRHFDIVPIVQPSGISASISVDDWVKEQFSFVYLDEFAVLEKPFDGLDIILLLSWVRQRFSDSESQYFALHYWDLGLTNIIIDENDNLAGIIDWDDVGVVPVKLSAISIAESFAPYEIKFNLDPEQDELFRLELRRLEQENRNSTKWSQMFMHSRENLFLFDILRYGYSFTMLEEKHPDFLSEALLRNSERLPEAVAEWEGFVWDEYLSKGLDVPDYPNFLRIKEALEVYRRSN